MIKRTIDISDGPTYLNIENDQLILTREKQRIASIPCEDIGVLLINHRATVYTHSALTRVLNHGAVIVLCGEDHLPCGILLPLENNDLHTARLRDQVAAPVPLRKQLWRQIIRHKIRGQAMNLPEDHKDRRRLLLMAEEIKSGDSANAEGVAARFYWPALMGPDFRRDPEGAWPNPLLNYGYMVFRAAVARAIVAAGLHPALGLYHSNRNNPFVLADDLVEVFRPRIDRAVVDFVKADAGGLVPRTVPDFGEQSSSLSLRAESSRTVEMNTDAKRVILSLLTESITVAGQSGPLMVSLHRMVGSLVKCFAGEQKTLDLPELETGNQRQETGTETNALPE